MCTLKTSGSFRKAAHLDKEVIPAKAGKGRSTTEPTGAIGTCETMWDYRLIKIVCPTKYHSPNRPTSRSEFAPSRLLFKGGLLL